MAETTHMLLVPRSFDGCDFVMATTKDDVISAHLAVILRSEFTLKTWFFCNSPDAVQFDQEIVEYDE